MTDVPAAVRRAIIIVYKGRCQYCRAENAAHVEHIIARANGGTSDLENLTLACESCNLAESSLRLSEDFTEIMLARAAKRIPTIRKILAEPLTRKSTGSPRVPLRVIRQQALDQAAAGESFYIP